MSENHKNRLVPIIIAVSIVIGISLGTFYTKRFSTNPVGMINTPSNKIDALLRIIDMQYVDTMNINDIIEDAMPKILGELDPHSSYIPAKDLEATNAELRGSFSGIGVQFMIQEDTIHISQVIPGGPSEKVGIMPGDRIISINDTAFVGKIVTNQESMKRLKGPKDSQVKIGVFRHGEKETLYFNIVRGNIPVKSVDAAYMINKKFGYVKINKFAETTYPELLIALAKFSQQNCQGIIVDLRDNTGGYMEVAIQMVNEFLPKNRLIVYTEGRKFPRKDYFSNGTGSNQEMPIVVLINESSASASEIFSGAIQDNDRGTIIGRRSFGKGLVQQPIEFKDGSAIRLTIARYYTPSGRCIQKPYVKGGDDNYEMDIIKRYEHGEFFSQDSIKQDETTSYHTLNGRTVYGGGGIMPDIFVPQDTTGFTSYYQQAASRGLLRQFTFKYSDGHRDILQQYDSAEEMLAHLKKQHLLEQFARFAQSKGLKRRNRLMNQSKELFELNIYGGIIYNILDLEDYIKFLNQTDQTVLKALDILEKGTSVPALPNESTAQDNDERKEK